MTVTNPQGMALRRMGNKTIEHGPHINISQVGLNKGRGDLGIIYLWGPLTEVLPNRNRKLLYNQILC